MPNYAGRNTPNQIEQLIASVNELAIWHKTLILDNPCSPAAKRRTIKLFHDIGHLNDFQAGLLLESCAGDRQ